MNERYRTIKLYNLDKIGMLEPDFFQMPILKKDEIEFPDELVGFNYLKTRKGTQEKAIHFFLDDYQFERIWKNPDAYLEKLYEYGAVLTPDFSLYLDMPESLKIYNTYRSRLIGQYMQSFGIKVIPTISWADEKSFKYCFSGVAPGSTVAISTIGVMRTEKSKGIFREGAKKMMEIIKPEKVLVFGKKIDFEFGNCKYYNNEIIKKFEKR